MAPPTRDLVACFIVWPKTTPKWSHSGPGPAIYFFMQLTFGLNCRVWLSLRHTQINPKRTYGSGSLRGNKQKTVHTVHAIASYVARVAVAQHFYAFVHVFSLSFFAFFMAFSTGHEHILCACLQLTLPGIRDGYGYWVLGTRCTSS